MRAALIRLASVLAKRYPFVSGQCAVANTRAARWLFATQSGDARKATFRDYTVLAKVNDGHGRATFLFGCNDGKIRDLFRALVRPGDTVLDIGANYGTFSLLSCRLAGPSGVVHAFEANPELAALLEESAKLSGFQNLTVHSLALSNKSGRTTLHMPVGETGHASLDKADHATVAVDVAMAEAGPYLTELNLAPIQLLKIDTEKHEYPIFQSGHGFLTANPPRFIIFEYNEPSVRFWDAPLVSLLQSLGYEAFYSVPRTYFRTCLRPMRRGNSDVGKAINFVAVHRLTDSSAITHLLDRAS